MPYFLYVGILLSGLAVVQIAARHESPKAMARALALIGALLLVFATSASWAGLDSARLSLLLRVATGLAATAGAAVLVRLLRRRSNGDAERGE